MYIHGVMVNEADGVWEQRVEEDNFVWEGHDNRGLEETA
jgi:hypothetical protein